MNLFQEKPQIFWYILWSFKARFKLPGHINRHNYVHWDMQNLHFLIETQLNVPRICTCGCFVSLSLVYPHFFGESYLEMLQNCVVPNLHMHFDDFSELYFYQDMFPISLHACSS